MKRMLVLLMLISGGLIGMQKKKPKLEIETCTGFLFEMEVDEEVKHTPSQGSKASEPVEIKKASSEEIFEQAFKIGSPDLPKIVSFFLNPKKVYTKVKN